MQPQIRRSQPADFDAIFDTVSEAFQEPDSEVKEHVRLVKHLLADPTAKPYLSLVAVADEHVVGFILFTSVHINNSQKQVSASILAPIAVRPFCQNKGIGRLLIKKDIERLKTMDVELLFVLGPPGYYPKFGFLPAGAAGFTAPYPIPGENEQAWMVQALRPGIIQNISGKVNCADTLDDPSYW